MMLILCGPTIATKKNLKLSFLMIESTTPLNGYKGIPGALAYSIALLHYAVAALTMRLHKTNTLLKMLSKTSIKKIFQNKN